MRERYIAHPVHLYVYCLPLLVIGTAVFTWGWEALGTTIFLAGVGVGLWVLIGGILETWNEWGNNLVDNLQYLTRNKDPEAWAVLKLERLPPTTQARYSKLLDKPGELPPEPPSPPSPTTRYFTLPVSLPIMKDFSDGVLSGNPLAELYWAEEKGIMTLPQARKLKQLLRKEGFIRYKPGGRTQGYELTPAGIVFLLGYANEIIKQQYATHPELLKDQPALSDLNK
jgi:hypothetical protein